MFSTGQSPEWREGKSGQGVTGRYTVWTHDPTGVSVSVQNSGFINFIRGNASKLAFQTDHNWNVVETQNLFNRTLEGVTEVMNPILSRPLDLDTVSFSQLEFGLVVQKPFSDFEVLLGGLNYPELRKPGQFVPGESIKFGTSKRRKLSLRIYDKGKELRRKNRGESVPPGEYTRIEFSLSSKQMRKHFGGDKREHLTLANMSEVFYDLLYKLDSMGTRRTPGFNLKTKADLLALTLKQEAQLRDHGVETFSVSDLFLSSFETQSNARKVLGEARGILAASNGRGLRDLVPPPEKMVA